MEQIQINNFDRKRTHNRKNSFEDYPPTLDERGSPIETKIYRLGSVSYQNILLQSVLYKLRNHIQLNPEEESFIDVQGEFCDYPFREIVERIKKGGLNSSQA